MRKEHSKGPETETSLACSRNQKVIVAGTECARKWKGGVGVREDELGDKRAKSEKA